MGVTIQAESHRVELAGLYEYEHDQQVLEFYDQPPAIKLVYQAKNGRQVGVWHTPDYFVLRADGIGWEEWKTAVGLEHLSQTMPNRYGRDAVGHWRCPPGERFAAEFGLSYRLRSSSEIDWVLQRNLRFLNDYLIKPPLVDQQTAETVLALVKQRPGLQLAALLDTLGEAQVDDIYTLIVSGRIYVDLHAAALAEAQHVQLFADQETASAYVMVDNARTIAGGIAADIPQLLAEANPADLREANRRHAIITPYLAGVDAPSSAASARTIRRWLAQWRLAEQSHGCGYLGLLPKSRQRGNRKHKLPQATLALIDEFLTSEYETLKQKRKFVVYAALQRACDARGLIAPSLPDLRSICEPPTSPPADCQTSGATGCSRGSTLLLGAELDDATTWRPTVRDRPSRSHPIGRRVGLLTNRAQSGPTMGNVLERRFLATAAGRVPDVRPTQLSVVHVGTPRMRASLRAATGGHRRRRRTRV